MLLQSMLFIQLLLELVICRICGWVGYITVKAVTFGKVELDWGNSSGSFIAELIGAGVLLALALLVYYILGY